MSKAHIQPPPVRAHGSKSAFTFNRFLPMLSGALAGGVVFLAIACLWVINSRPEKVAVDDAPSFVALDGSDHTNEPEEPVAEPAHESTAHEKPLLPTKEVETVSNVVPSNSNDPPTTVKTLVESTISHEEKLASTHDRGNSHDRIRESESKVSGQSSRVESVAATRELGKELVPVVEKAEPPKFVDVGDSPRPNEDQLKSILEVTAVNVDLHRFPAVKTTLDNELKSDRTFHRRHGRVRTGADEFTHSDVNEFHPMLKVADASRELYGFPFLRGDACEINPKHAPSMALMSTQLRSVAVRPFGGSGNSDPKFMIAQFVSNNKKWHTEEAIPALMQMLQAADHVVRYALIDILSSIEGSNASIALAKLAMFDLWSGVREVAIGELSQRPKDEYRGELLRGLQYPWPPVAQHAAEALIGVDDKKSVEYLVRMLDNEDPNAPFKDDAGRWCRKQLVRVNHMRNRNMCHPPSFAHTDQIRGLVPSPGQPLPVGYSHNKRNGEFVRADVTYIRQDFSAMHTVERAKPWPSRQRFDYFIRSRPLSKSEMVSLLKITKSGSLGLDEAECEDKNYPQRNSVLYALRRLTGLDLGESTKAWRDYCHKDDKVASHHAVEEIR